MGRPITIALSFTLALLHIHLAEAQPLKKTPRIGYLSIRLPPQPAAPPDVHDEAFYQGLRELGYSVGKNLIIDYRYAERKPRRFPELAAELVRSKVDLIVATSTPAIKAAKQATSTIPIVMLSAGDPVTAEFIDSLARPGGNITGVTAVVPELGGKLLQVLVDAVPRANRVAVLWDPRPSERLLLRPTQEAARSLAVRLNIVEARSLDDFEKLFLATKKDGSRGLLVFPGLLFTMNQRRIVELSIKYRLPAIYWQEYFAEVGGLLAYGPSLPHQFRRIGVLAGKILKGSKPTELPVEQPTKYGMVVNLATAEQIGLTIPPNVLARADRVIR